LANKYANERDLYGLKYDGSKKPFSSFDEIPLLTKDDLINFTIEHKKEIYSPYTSPYINKLHTSGSWKKVGFPYCTDSNEMDTAFNELWETQLFKEIGFPQIIIQPDFGMTDHFYETENQLKERKKTFDKNRPKDYELVKNEVESYGEQPILFIGNFDWLLWIVSFNLCYKDNHYLCVMPKETGVSEALLKPPFVDKKIISVFATTEIGIVGYKSNWRCNVNGYHIYRSDCYIEIFNGKLHGTFERKALPLIRYCLEDYGQLIDEPCTCGFTGKSFVWLGKVLSR